jgi:hypothetical protein
MDENQQQGDGPNGDRDLSQLEYQPGPRADPLFERQTDDTEVACYGFRARLHSDTPVRSPVSTATALTRLVLAAGLPAAAVVAGGRALGIAGGLILTLALIVFLLIGGVGLFLILRIEHGTSEINSGEDKYEDRGTDLPRADRRGRRARRHIQHPSPVRPRRAAQPPGPR